MLCMEAHPDVHLTHDELAEKFGIAKATMKRCLEEALRKVRLEDIRPHSAFTCRPLCF